MNYRILYVEDDEVDRMALKRAVTKKRLPYQVTYAPSFESARTLLKTSPFDVVICDYHLGDGTALEVLDLVGEIPFIVVTGLGDEETAVNAMRAGASDYLTKDAERKYLEVLPMTVEAAVKLSEFQERVHLLSQAVEAMEDAVFILDPEDNVVFVNAAFENTYGYNRSDIYGKHAIMLWEQAEDMLKLRNDRTPHRVVSQRRQNGEVFSTSMTVTRVKRGGGGVWGEEEMLVIAARDTAERDRILEQLRENEERHALALRGSNDGIWDWKLHSNEIFFSERWKEQLGFTDAELENKASSWFARVHPDDQDRLNRAIHAHLRNEEPHFQCEYRIKHKDGRWRFVLARGLALRDKDGVAYRMAGSQTDLSMRQEQVVR
jgi:PAS domain S-box-containing protein